MEVQYNEVIKFIEIMKPKKKARQRYIRALKHTSSCQNTNCNDGQCEKMKKNIQHTKECKDKVLNNCKTCTTMFAMCLYHAKNCTVERCGVPICAAIKEQMKQAIRRRYATMCGS